MNNTSNVSQPPLNGISIHRTDLSPTTRKKTRMVQDKEQMAAAVERVTQQAQRAKLFLSLIGNAALPVGYSDSCIVLVTPEIAQQWLTDFHFHGQRNPRPSKIDEYAFDMERGDFGITELRLIQVGDKVYLTNGQHRLKAVVQSNAMVLFNVLHIVVSSIEQTQKDYGHADTGLGRDWASIFAATDIPERSGLTPTKFNKYQQTLRAILGGFQSSAFGSSGTPQMNSYDNRMRAAEDWMPSATAYYESIYGAEIGVGKMLLRKPILAVGLVITRYQPEKAREFWHGVAMCDGLRTGDPRRTLHHYILNNPSNHVGPASYARAVAHAWNAYFLNKPLKIIRPPDATRPILIEGTPYDGEQVILKNYDEVPNEPAN